jgi:DNA invertase Pin-like site-specific DNA recombinase
MAKGIKFGRKRSIDRTRLIQLHNDGMGATDITNKLEIGRSTVYKIINEEIGTKNK